VRPAGALRELLDEGAEVEPSGAAADHRDPHVCNILCS
jgi:hypothetical protein